MRLSMKYILLLTILLSSGAFASEFDDMKTLADEGNVDAQYNLGVMYDNGEGVPENDIKAHVWYSMAKTSGNESGKKNLRILKTEMTKDQIAQAQELATKCYESNYKDCD